MSTKLVSHVQVIVDVLGRLALGRVLLVVRVLALPHVLDDRLRVTLRDVAVANLTCHMSHVTRQTSDITRQTLLVTRHFTNHPASAAVSPCPLPSNT